MNCPVRVLQPIAQIDVTTARANRQSSAPPTGTSGMPSNRRNSVDGVHVVLATCVLPVDGSRRSDGIVTFDRQPLLAGEILDLRPLRPSDFDALYAIASDPLLWEQHPSKDRAQRSVFERWFEDAMASGGALVAIARADGKVIGTSRFDRYDAARREVEIGWTFLDRSLWGGLFNREMKQLMLEHAFHAVDSVVFRVHSGNVRSQRAVEKLGAIRVGMETDPHGRGENCVFRLQSSRSRI